MLKIPSSRNELFLSNAVTKQIYILFVLHPRVCTTRIQTIKCPWRKAVTDARWPQYEKGRNIVSWIYLLLGLCFVLAHTQQNQFIFVIIPLISSTCLTHLNNSNAVCQSPVIAMSREKKSVILELNVKVPEQYLIDLIPLNGRWLTKRPWNSITRLQSMTDMLFTVNNFNSRAKRRRETVIKVNYVGI